MKTIVKIINIFVFILVPAISMAQQDFSHVLPNAQSIGVGGSAVALSQDPAASYWNPATIAFLTTNRVLINIDSESNLNYIGLTSFFPPSFALGVSLFRLQDEDYHYDMATVSAAYRFFSFLSVGTNVNVSKTMEDKVYSSFGLGIFFKSMPDYRMMSMPSNTLWNWLRSKNMHDKFNFGISLHNYPLNENNQHHEFRIGASIKPTSLGPLIHFAYHRTPDDYSVHLGTIIQFSRHGDIYFGVNDLDINNFTVGGAMEWGPFEVNMSYDLKYSKIYASLLLRLSEDRSSSFQKFRDMGNQQIKSNNFSGAFRSYLKAFAYEPDNEEISYLIEVLQKESNQTKYKIDSLYASGENFENRGWYINAFSTYQKILEIQPKNRKARKRLKGLNSKLKPYLNQIFRRGVLCYNEPNLSRAKLIFNQILVVNKNHQGAKTYLAKIDSINSTKADEYYYRGVGYYQQKNLARAEQEFKNALAFNPDHEQAKLYLKKAAREIESNNQSIERYLRQARNYEQNKQYVKALHSYRKILEIDKSHQYAKNRLAYLDNHINKDIQEKFRRAKQLYDRKEYSGSISILREILSIAPDHNPSKSYLRRANAKLQNLVDQHYQRAQYYFNQKKWDIVLQECDLTLKMNRDHSGARALQKTALANISNDQLLAKGLNYFERGDYLTARSIFQQVLAKEPSNTSARTYLARIENELNLRIEELFNTGLEKYAEGAYEEAIQEWKKIFQIDPNHESAKKYIKNAQERIDALKNIK